MCVISPVEYDDDDDNDNDGEIDIDDGDLSSWLSLSPSSPRLASFVLKWMRM